MKSKGKMIELKVVNEFYNTYFYEKYEIISELPRIGEEFNGEIITGIIDAYVDVENKDEVYDYRFFNIYFKNEDGENSFFKVAIDKYNLLTLDDIEYEFKCYDINFSCNLNTDSGNEVYLVFLKDELSDLVVHLEIKANGVRSLIEQIKFNLENNLPFDIYDCTDEDENFYERLIQVF